MGGRYLVTGTQLGMLITLCKTDAVACNKLINEIIEKQFVFDSDKNISVDVNVSAFARLKNK